jgi:hypothetical protein
MDMERSALVRFGDFLGIDVLEPVVSGQGPRVMEDKPAEREVDVRVFLDAPIRLAQISVHRFVDVEHELFGVADRLVSRAVEDVRLRDADLAFLNKDGFDDVLNLLDRGDRVRVATRHHDAEFFLYLIGDVVRPVGVRGSLAGGDRLGDGMLYFRAVIRGDIPRALNDVLDNRRVLGFLRGPEKMLPFGEYALFRLFSRRCHSILPLY